MKKKTPPPKNKKLRYETDKLYRWNLCQKLARSIYVSKMTNDEIFNNMDNVEKMEVINNY